MSAVAKDVSAAPRVSADDIAGCLARNTFKDALCVVDRCNYLPAECDLLVIAPCLRYIDVEIKISRGDLKADRSKAKWWQSPGIALEWPRQVWKHYYAMPAAIWKPELVQFVHATSGVLLVHCQRANAKPRTWRVECVKRSKPCKNAPQAGPESIRAIARLASLRMWDAYAELRERVTDATPDV
jgi:hypothetical protein